MPPPLDPALPGIRAGIDEVLANQAGHDRKLDGLNTAIADVHAEVLHHGVRLRKLERLTEEHAERITDLERMPRATHSRPSVGVSIPPLASLGKETQSGSWIIPPDGVEKYTKIREDQLAAAKWRAMLSGGWKLALLVAGAVILAGLSVLGGALLQQAAQHPPTLTIPSH